MAYKMKGSPMQRNFGIGSPMKQDKLGAKEKLTKKPKKYSLHAATKKDGTREYFKVSGGESTDGGKTFAPSVETKISEAEYNSYFPKKKKDDGKRLKESFKKVK